MSEGNSPSQSKEGYIGPLRRRYEPIRNDVDTTLQSSGINPHESAFRKARKAFSRKIFGKEEESGTDPMTGIPNRKGLEIILATELPLAQRLGVDSVNFEIDLDGLKILNDTRGHEAGDKLILDFVEAVRSSVRGSDAFARIGGDEFRLILFGTSLENAGVKWNEIKARLAGKKINASAGIAKIDYNNYQDSIRKADAAMYGAKQQYKTTGIAQLGVAT